MRRFWPYDEVSISRELSHPGRFLLTAPWIKFPFEVGAADLARAEAILEKLAKNEIAPRDLNDVTWLFTPLTKYPVAYILPRAEISGGDSHRILGPLESETPTVFALGLASKSSLLDEVSSFIAKDLAATWTWDIGAALDFSKTKDGHDPESLFSVARRFHLLNDLENNRTADLLAAVSAMKDEPVKFRTASAHIVRQNHYVTEKCDATLRTAIPIAQNAADEILEFVAAEHGHDKLLAKALRSLGEEPASVPAISSVVVLMEVFRLAAERNLLGFAMVTDIFERSSYRSEDPLTALLREGGETVAARMADVHREINDQGGHENVALEFLSEMSAVDAAYASEALRLAELATLVVHRVSVESLQTIRAF